MPSGPARSQDPFAIVDLGSNTVRLVVFESIARVPVPLFNERIFCGLGRHLGSTGRLDKDAIPDLMRCLDRFGRIATSLGAKGLHVLATAAVREAVDGPELVERLKRRTKGTVQVLSGRAEARLAALGVLCGIPDADGIVGDLGGGSLELVEVRRGAIGRSISLPLGPLRLAEIGRGRPQDAEREVAEQLRRVSWLERGRGRNFYAVGGSWRALAQMHMNRTQYPIHIVHEYAPSRAEVRALARRVRVMGAGALARLDGIAERRLEMLPLSAGVMDAVIARMKPAQIVFSATGLREGYLFDRLGAREQDKDPLLAAAATLSVRESRDKRFGEHLVRWTDPIFAHETTDARRLRRAACLVSDIGWREHPDYRARQVLSHMLHFPFLGLGHRDRVALAVALFIRCGGKLSAAEAERSCELLDRTDLRWAAAIGAALRLGYAVSGGSPAILDASALRPRGGRLDLALTAKAWPLGPQVEKAYKTLLRALRMFDGRIVPPPSPSRRGAAGAAKKARKFN